MMYNSEVMTIKKELSSQLHAVLEELGVSDSEPKVEYPSDPKHGDYSSNVALVAAKKLKKNPLELAEEIAAKLRVENGELRVIEKIEVVKPGFINFWISEKSLIASVEKQELPDLGKGRPVVVEYSSPNIAKPFTIGHLRSTIIGDAIANLLQATGWSVHRDNHIGDWGTQFGKQIYAIKTWGNESEIEKSDRPVKLLVDLYVRFHEEAEKDPTFEDKAREWFKKLEDGDSEARQLWQKCIEWSWKEFSSIYDELGVPSMNARFENNGRGYGESFFEDKMSSVIDELKERHFLTTGKEGAQIVEFSDETKLPPLMILKKDGATLYSTRDLATDRFRLEKYGRDVTIVNEVGAEQSLYFNQLYQLEEMLGWYKKGQRIHIKHGLYRFKDQKMSTRKGNVIWLEDVLEEAKKRALFLKSEKQQKATLLTGATETERTPEEKRGGTISSKDQFENTAIIGIGALKWNDLKRSSEQDIIFDWDDMLTMQGNSGPYIQYTYARTQSVIARSKATKQSYEDADQSGGLPRASLEALAMTKPEERELLRLLSRFSEVVEESAVRFAPHILCTYLFDTAQAFNVFYQKCPILKVESEQQSFRLLLTQSTGETLKKGLTLLGIESPEKM